MKFDSDTGAVLVLIVMIASAYAYAKSMIPWWGIPAGIFMMVIVIQSVESLFKPNELRRKANDAAMLGALLGGTVVAGAQQGVQQTLPGGSSSTRTFS
jgi:hypothetical protein